MKSIIKKIFGGKSNTTPETKPPTGWYAQQRRKGRPGEVVKRLLTPPASDGISVVHETPVHVDTPGNFTTRIG